METLLMIVAGFGVLVGGIIGFLVGERTAKPRNANGPQTLHLHQDGGKAPSAVGFGMPGIGVETDDDE